ncbi:hypothetical protein DTW90_01265 [Neorhizobium sp. P12A]|jgi:hypothetical protein|uniref:cell division protein FtsL n=1 Tax=Rhizobium/Agrobacterium group TaxID=227290 RepID=UPI001052C308|nr:MULTISPECIES: hypothetical protein [Rhizobium/Agrobacterium group]KAA0700341.1 hypothetical protein DTW90_01265 [Neorhizobium sp. P12A]TCR83487.1 hypothetical protein EV561_10917 [Rhizobium sp. BK376]
MLRTFDIVLIGVMTAAATVTYTIKHRAELKLEEVHHLESEIKLEKDTIELLKADWALVVQPNRLEKLVNIYNDDLKLQPTISTSLAQPNELPMLRSQLPPPPVVADTKNVAPAKPTKGSLAAKNGDATDAEIRAVIADVASKPAPKPVAKATGLIKRPAGKTDNISTGSVKR